MCGVIVPCTSKDNPGLARWVQTLRAAYKEKQKKKERYYGQLTDERLKRLEDLGFQWSISGTCSCAYIVILLLERCHSCLKILTQLLVFVPF